MFKRMLDRRTVATMGSALLVALFFSVPRFYDQFVIYIGYRLLSVGDTLFHEMGHAAFAWLYGYPAIPAIMTAIGANIASGFTPTFGHSWTIQLLMTALLIYGCYKLRGKQPILFWPVSAFALLMVGVGFTPYAELVISYMGHGSAILTAGILLYRAWLDIVVKTPYERWCNALFGFFILIQNGIFGYLLAYAPDFRARYAEGVIMNDFLKMHMAMPHWSVGGLGLFTLIASIATGLLAFILAAYFYEDEHYLNA